MKPLRALIALAILVGSAALPASAEFEEGTISGTVTSPTGAPLAGICVEIFEAWQWEYAGWYTTTDDAGAYSVDYLSIHESYEIRFTDCNETPGYVTEWFDDAPSRYASETVSVTDGGVTEASAVLALGGSISGTVTDPQGRPIRDLCVFTLDASERVGWGYTDSAGAYTVGALAEGAQAVQFGCSSSAPPMFSPRPVGLEASSATPAPGIGEDYVSEWFDDAESWETATPVVVGSGLDTPAISATLVLGASISGTVTDEDGELLSACVTAYQGDQWARSTEAYGDWGYKLRGLPAGTYKIQFWDCGDYAHRSEWYEDAISIDRATPVTVALGGSISGVDAALAKRPVADLAITGLSVRAVPTETDLASVPLGTQRDVQVEISNLGGAEGWYVGAHVWVELPDGRTETLGTRYWSRFTANDIWRGTFRWDTTGTFGDAQVHAEVCTFDDANPNNDQASTRTFTVVGGTGQGLSLRNGPHGYCYGWNFDN